MERRRGVRDAEIAVVAETSADDSFITGRSLRTGGRNDRWWSLRSELVMLIGNQEFGIPGKYQYQIGIWYLCLKFLGIFLVFYRNLEYDLVKSWFNIGIFRQNKNRFGIWFLWLPFHWYRFRFGLSFS